MGNWRFHQRGWKLMLRDSSIGMENISRDSRRNLALFDFYGATTAIKIVTRTWLRYVPVFAIANPSVVCNVRASYSGGWNFRQYFFTTLYPSHPLTFVQNFTKIVPGKTPVGGVKRKKGSKIERCHVRVSHLLTSLLFSTVERYSL